MTAPHRPPAPGFRLVRYFAVVSLAAFVLFAAALLYFARLEDDFHEEMQQEQNAFFSQVQIGFAKRQDAAAHADLLRVHEAGNVNLTRLFANALWDKDFAPFAAKAQRIPVDQCRAIADVKDAGGKTVPAGEKQACHAGIGEQIMALPEFRALDAKVFDLVKKTTVFKIKVFDLRGITVYSSEHNQIGEDKAGNAGWESAMAGKSASQLTHRGKFTAFEGEVANRDLISSYVPVLAPGSERIVAVFEVYSDVTQFLEHVRNSSSHIQKLSAENRAQLERAAAANHAKVDANAVLLLAIILGLLALLYCALFLIVRHGQRIIDQEKQKIARLSRIHAVMSAINSLIVHVRDRQELFDGACRIAVEQGELVMAWIGLLDPTTQDVTPVAKAGRDEGYLEQITLTLRNDVTYRSLTAEALMRAVPIACNDISADERMSRWRDEALKRGYRSVAFFPLLIEQRPIGIFVLYAPELGAFDEQEMKLLGELADDISFALAYIAKEEKLNYLAYYDALTGLPNRALFDDRMTQVLRTASHEQNKVALVLIDLERFRALNDTLGRSAGDELLKLVAQRLQSVIFDRDSLARIHADIFAGLFPDIKDEADIARIVEEKIIARLNEPFTIAGQELRVSAKIGVALFPGDATEPDALFSCAEAALRQAKDSSDRYLFYARKMNAQVAERLKLENKLQRALERDEFVLFYQPKVDLGTGRVAGLEALMRWNDPGTGLVPPMLFIPLLEETGMIVEVGAWAMKQAVSQYAAWQAAGLQPPPIAVNVSAVQLKRKDFVTSVQQAIAIAGKPDHGLDLEITESMIMEDIEDCIGKLKLIRDLGVGISIDDFGTGHSSLRYLTRLPITALKIDRAFIQHMTTNSDDVAIVSTVIALGRTLKLKVIAEGVETEEQSKFLWLLKCDEMQGYLFSKPVPADEVPALLAKR